MKLQALRHGGNCSQWLGHNSIFDLHLNLEEMTSQQQLPDKHLVKWHLLTRLWSVRFGRPPC
jgi:hypothetical protein